MTESPAASSAHPLPHNPASFTQHRFFAVILAVLAATIAAGIYLPSLSGAFVYDDIAVIRDSTYIHDPANWSHVLTLKVMAEDVIDFNRPVQVASLMLDAAIWGKEPLGYRLTNLLLHAACTFLVVILAARLLRESLTPVGKNMGETVLGMSALVGVFLAGLLFALHPMMVEAAAVPSNRKDQLATFFLLIAFLAATRFRAVLDLSNIVLAAVCTLCTLLAIGAKENGVAGPPILFMYWWLLRRREKPVAWLSLIAVCSLACVLFLAARFALEREVSEVFITKPSAISPTIKGRANIQVGFMVLYAKNIFLPAWLCADYNLRSLEPIYKYPFLREAVMLFLGGVVILCSMRSALCALAVWIVLFAILPVANLVPIYVPAADRYWYLPMLGLSIMVALASVWVGRHAPRPAAAAALVVSLVLAVVLAGLTLQRIAVWDNTIALWRDTLDKNDRSVRAHTGLATEYANTGRLGEAAPHWKQAAEFVRNRPDYWVNVIVLNHSLGRTGEAYEAIRSMLEVYPEMYYPDSVPRTGYLASVDMDTFSRIVAQFRSANPYFTPPRRSSP